MGQNGAGRVYQIAYQHYNMGGQMSKWMDDYKKRFNDDMFTGSIAQAMQGLSSAMAKAKSTDPVKVAAALEGLSFTGFNGDVEMRKIDHQLQQPLVLTVWQKADKKYAYSPENTGMTLAPVRNFPTSEASTFSSCQMKRPG